MGSILIFVKKNLAKKMKNGGERGEAGFFAQKFYTPNRKQSPVS
jgi:hypothetical protein